MLTIMQQSASANIRVHEPIPFRNEKVLEKLKQHALSQLHDVQLFSEILCAKNQLKERIYIQVIDLMKAELIKLNREEKELNAGYEALIQLIDQMANVGNPQFQLRCLTEHIESFLKKPGLCVHTHEYKKDLENSQKIIIQIDNYLTSLTKDLRQLIRA